MGLHTIYIKHNLFHQSNWEEMLSYKKHIVLFKSPRDVLQINTLSQQLGLGHNRKSGFKKQHLLLMVYGHSLIVLTPKTIDSLRYWTKNYSASSKLQSFWMMSIQNVSILQ